MSRQQTNKSIFIRYALIHLTAAILFYFAGDFIANTVGYKPVGWALFVGSAFQVLCVICKPFHLAYISRSNLA